MSQNNKVIWSEGMFLRPQHFQQAGRYIENYIQQRCESVRPCTWGFTKLQLDQKLLGLGKIGFVEASGVFPDGTPFN
ncbi:MAG: type VI secretion system baseplate subunit TssK, partial [Pseudomonadales bacterium]